MRTTLPKIHNLRTLSGDLSAPALLKRGIVRVDRKTPWGNPYPIGKRFGSRADVIERYRQDLWRRIRSGEMPLEELAALANRELACWCVPRPCHAEVLARAAIWAAKQLGDTGRSRPAPLYVPARHLPPRPVCASRTIGRVGSKYQVVRAAETRVRRGG